MEPTKNKVKYTSTTIALKAIPRSWVCLQFLLLLIILFATINTSLAGEKKIVAITAIVEHPSLVQAKNGIIDELQENGYEIGKNLEIIDKNAQGAIANAILIAKKFVAMKPDAIVPISTPSAQTVIKAAKGSGIPVIFSSVTDPVAAGIVNDLQVPLKNITGAIDYPLIDEEVQLIQQLVPTAKNIGFLYSSGEANSVKTIALMKKAIEGKMEYIDSQIANSNQLTQAFIALVGRVDVIYIPSDNTVFSALPKLAQMSKKHKLPIFSSDPDSVKQGITACIGYTQYAVGRTAGKLLVRVLKGEENIAIERPNQAQIFINKSSADIMGIATPEKLLGIKTEIVGVK